MKMPRRLGTGTRNALLTWDRQMELPWRLGISNENALVAWDRQWKCPGGLGWEMERHWRRVLRNENAALETIPPLLWPRGEIYLAMETMPRVLLAKRRDVRGKGS
jgi:hypothetical protein